MSKHEGSTSSFSLEGLPPDGTPYYDVPNEFAFLTESSNTYINHYDKNKADETGAQLKNLIDTSIAIPENSIEGSKKLLEIEVALNQLYNLIDLDVLYADNAPEYSKVPLTNSQDSVVFQDLCTNISRILGWESNDLSPYDWVDLVTGAETYFDSRYYLENTAAGQEEIDEGLASVSLSGNEYEDLPEDLFSDDMYFDESEMGSLQYFRRTVMAPILKETGGEFLEDIVTDDEINLSKTFVDFKKLYIENSTRFSKN